MVVDSYGGSKAATLEVNAPQLVIDALEEGRMSAEILANAIYGMVGNKCVIEARLILKDRAGKRRR